VKSSSEEKPSNSKHHKRLLFINDYAGFFFGHFEKNSSPKKLKTQGKSCKNSSQIPKKLKNRKLQLR